jgi:diguanylate cyclase (GGDEF)-like protein/PAS domain S-box-containing protein
MTAQARISGSEAAAALRDTQLDAVLGVMPDCVKIFDAEARLIYINPRGLELMEAPDLATLNGADHVPIPPEHIALCIDVHTRVVAGESLTWSYDVVGMKGGRHHVEAHSVPLPMADGTMAHLSISRDASQRKQAEDALQRLRLIQEATGLADFETHEDGIISPSGRFFEQIGLPPRNEPIKFADWLTYVHPDDRKPLHEEVLRAMREEDRIESEFRVIRADTGEVRWLATHSGVERNPAGEAVRTIGAHLDITDRKRTEEALRESEARLSAILEAMPDCVKIFDEHARIVYINPRGLELLEVADLETLNASGHVPVPAEYMAECIDVHTRVIAGETVVWSYEIVGIRGGRHHVEAHAVPFRMPDGARAHMCISRDITQRKQAEDALRRSEQRLLLVQEVTGLGDFETGADGQMAGSERFFEQLGLPVAEGPIEAKAWAKQVHPDDIGWLVEMLDAAIARQSADFSGEFRIVRADTGETRWLASNTRMEYAADGSPIRTIGAHLDITERKRAEEALRASEERLRLVQEATDLADFEAGPGGVAHISPRFVEQVGLPAGTTELPIEEWMKIVHPDDRERLWQHIEESLLSEDAFQCEFRIVRPDTGEVRWIHSRTKMERNEAGQVTRSIGAHLDITDRKHAEEALRESEERFRLAAEAAGLGVWDYDEVLDRREWSDRLRDIFGISNDTLTLADTANLCFHPADRDRFIALAGDVRFGKIERFEESFRIKRADDGRERWVAVNAWRTHKADRQSRRIIMTVRDVTEEKTAEERIRWSASHDPLTRLANRALFQEQLDQAIRRAKTGDKSVGVLMLDLDHFKQINDSLGHDVGDALLKLFAERLRSVVRARDTVARLGGDEFAIVVPDLQGEDQLVRLSRSIQERMRAPFVNAGRMLDCRVSLGASMFPAHGHTSREVLKNADVALYAAKAAGRATLMMYDAELRNDMQRRLAMVHLARNAIADDRVIPYYQPKLDLQSGTVDGFEALLRWRTPRGRIGQPAALEAAFEDLEVAAAISDRMIDRVIVDMRGWLDRGVAFKHVAVNASAAEFRRDNFAERVLDRLARAEIPTRCFQIEVTETVFLGRGAESVHRALALLNSQGVKIALDDFGTGYASLRHLKQFPVDIIKIDRSFVRDMEVDPGDEAIVRAVINLGKSLGIHVVAEGIESDAQAQRLVRLGCDFGQGFLFSKAVGANRVPALVGHLRDAAATAGHRSPRSGLRLVSGNG